MAIGQAEITPPVSVGQTLMVETQEVQQGRVKIMRMDFVFDRLIAEFVRQAVAKTALDAATRAPRGKPKVIVIAPVVLVVDGRTPEFSGPDDQGFIKQTALFQIGDQARNREIALRRQLRVPFLDLRMLIPESKVELNESHA